MSISGANPRPESTPQAERDPQNATISPSSQTPTTNPVAATPSAASPIPYNLPCIECGYNLRSLPTTGACTECRTPVAESHRYVGPEAGITLAKRLTTLRAFAAGHVIAVLSWFAVLAVYLLDDMLLFESQLVEMLAVPLFLVISALAAAAHIATRQFSRLRPFTYSFVFWAAIASFITMASLFADYYFGGLFTGIDESSSHPSVLVTANLAGAIGVGFAVITQALNLMLCARITGRHKTRLVLKGCIAVVIATLISTTALGLPDALFTFKLISEAEYTWILANLTLGGYGFLLVIGLTVYNLFVLPAAQAIATYLISRHIQLQTRRCTSNWRYSVFGYLVDDDIRCAGCDNNLFGLPASANCPRCETSIKTSVDPARREVKERTAARLNSISRRFWIALACLCVIPIGLIPFWETRLSSIVLPLACTTFLLLFASTLRRLITPTRTRSSLLADAVLLVGTTSLLASAAVSLMYQAEMEYAVVFVPRDVAVVVVEARPLSVLVPLLTVTIAAGIMLIAIVAQLAHLSRVTKTRNTRRVLALLTVATMAALFASIPPWAVATTQYVTYPGWGPFHVTPSEVVPFPSLPQRVSEVTRWAAWTGNAQLICVLPLLMLFVARRTLRKIHDQLDAAVPEEQPGNLQSPDSLTESS